VTKILYTDRRFVIGRGLREHASFKTFSPSSWAGRAPAGADPEVHQPPAPEGLRQPLRAWRRHLQEVVIPVISINKKRQSDVGKVEVELIGGGGKTITTGQLAVVLYQTEPVTEKRQPRRFAPACTPWKESRSRTRRS
jgi:hypothetical protein